MTEEFDKKLSNKIKEVIEDQNLPYNPEHWDLLLVKKKKKKRIILLWRYAAAVILFIASGSLGKFFFSSSNSVNPIKQEIIIGERNDSLEKKFLNNDKNTFIVNEDVDSLNKYNSKMSQTDSIITKTDILKLVSKTRVTVNENNRSIKSDVENNRMDLVNEKEIIAQNKTENKAKDEVFKDQNIVVNNESKKDSLKDINELIATNTKEKIDLKENTSKSIKIGLNISSEINYNQEYNNSNFGLAGGVSMDIPISKKLDIYSGILYTNQKLNLNNQNLIYDSGQGIISGESKQITSEKAILKGIEIPINLKYNFSINNKKVFISSGFSSTYYFKENIESGFVVSSRVETTIQDSFGNNIVQYELVQSNEKVIKSSDNSFNFANILNLSMGIEFPLKKQRQSIVLEPYFKYSIKPITKENIDFSSVGIFLRYNFSFYRK